MPDPYMQATFNNKSVHGKHLAETEGNVMG